jgi:hypothetical protein
VADKHQVVNVLRELLMVDPEYNRPDLFRTIVDGLDKRSDILFQAFTLYDFLQETPFRLFIRDNMAWEKPYLGPHVWWAIADACQPFKNHLDCSKDTGLPFESRSFKAPWTVAGLADYGDHND